MCWIFEILRGARGQDDLKEDDLRTELVGPVAGDRAESCGERFRIQHLSLLGAFPLNETVEIDSMVGLGQILESR